MASPPPFGAKRTSDIHSSGNCSPWLELALSRSLFSSSSGSGRFSRVCFGSLAAFISSPVGWASWTGPSMKGWVPPLFFSVANCNLWAFGMNFHFMALFSVFAVSSARLEAFMALISSLASSVWRRIPWTNNSASVGAYRRAEPPLRPERRMRCSAASNGSMEPSGRAVALIASRFTSLICLRNNSEGLDLSSALDSISAVWPVRFASRSRRVSSAVAPSAICFIYQAGPRRPVVLHCTISEPSGGCIGRFCNVGSSLSGANSVDDDDEIEFPRLCFGAAARCAGRGRRGFATPAALAAIDGMGWALAVRFALRDVSGMDGAIVVKGLLVVTTGPSLPTLPLGLLIVGLILGNFTADTIRSSIAAAFTWGAVSRIKSVGCAYRLGFVVRIMRLADYAVDT